MVEFARGDIVVVEEEDWRFTAVVAQSEKAGISRTVILCPVVKGKLPAEVPLRLVIPRGVRGVGRPAEVAVDELVTVDNSAVLELVGRLSSV